MYIYIYIYILCLSLGPGFDSRWERCNYRASRPSQGTGKGGAVSKWPRCRWDVKLKQPTISLSVSHSIHLSFSLHLSIYIHISVCFNSDECDQSLVIIHLRNSNVPCKHFPT